MRSIFSSGLLDGFLRHNFDPFDFYIGVSAGAGNLLYFAGRQPGYSLDLYQHVLNSPGFLNFRRFMLSGDLIDLDWLFELLKKDSRFCLKSDLQINKPLLITLTDVARGRAVYHDMNRSWQLEAVKASMSLPLLVRRFPQIDGHLMADGGIADGIPVQKAIELGAKKIMVVRSRQRDYIKKDTPWHRYIRYKMRRFPLLHACMQNRIEQHESVKQLIDHPPKGVSIVDICPPVNFSMSRFSRNPRQLLKGYRLGFNQAKQAISQWQSIPVNY